MSNSHSSRLMISVSGIRGVVGQSLTPAHALEFVGAYAAYLWDQELQIHHEQPLVLLARDTRTSGEMMRHAALAALIGSGCRVIDLGIVSTPTLQLAIPFHQADGALCITASHNPADWNALKFFQPNGMYLDKAMGSEFLRKREAKEFYSAAWDKMGSVESDVSATERHIQKVLDFVDVEAIRAKNYKVVLDGCNGAGNTVSPRLLEILGCEVVHINKELDGIFPHNPEPLPQNLVQLCEAVKEHGGDIGFAHDADADRVAIVTNDGEFIGEDYSLVWAVAHILKNHKRGPVVTNLSTSMAVEAVAKPFDCPVYRAPVGDINVSGKMHEVGAVIGGEGNGGVIIPDIQFGRDGIAAIGLTLDFLDQRRQNLRRNSSFHSALFQSQKHGRFPQRQSARLVAMAQSQRKNRAPRRAGRREILLAQRRRRHQLGAHSPVRHRTFRARHLRSDNRRRSQTHRTIHAR